MNTTQQVEAILKYAPKARNSDTELLIIYWLKAGMNLSEAQIAKFKELPSPETLRRTRQKLQEHGKYPASEQVNEARYKKFKYVRSNIKYEDPIKLLEAQGKYVLPPWQ